MNRLAFSTLPCEGWSTEKMAAIARECGFGGIELREGEAWGISAAMTQAARQSALRLFEEQGIRVTNIGSGVCFTGSEGDKAELARYRDAVLLARDLKAAGVRIFLGYFNTRLDDPAPPVDYENIVARIRDACEFASAHGVRTWIETHNEFATGRSLNRLLEDVGKPDCAVIYDIIHPLEEGESPEETIALLGERCVHVHIKDGVPFEDPLERSWKYTKLGEGRVPVADIVRRLERAGYEGYYSLEWESKWRKELQTADADPAIVFPRYVAFMRNVLRAGERGVPQ
ncbi:sugar phosphate isomerase/epimerase family protein [Paenibacillus glycinis]|uniref:TIM barrel protein n=1 Tax=Paenibacillus glycinis TaxID=2697035 RepID=A0ABW9XMQ0_9BACL|nr:sugar phosphate isomerase/epimerase family protein [Paenibacillus glycinis]NBD23896.1 TIM barrel protein [Paenibacillus glycinis]